MTNHSSGATGILVVHRQHYFRHFLATITVVLDGAKVCRLRNGASVDLPVAAGTHRVHVLMPWVSSPDLAVDVPPAGVVRVDVRLTGSPLRMFYAWNRYFRLDGTASTTAGSVR